MSPNRSFDRAASIYDQTRPLFGPIAKHGIQAILDIAGSNARILEVGAGTGRISVPLLKRGADLVGCDLSSKMLFRLKEKLPSARIAQADASRLPFSTANFDVVLTVHVLHLIPSWREALLEFRRVLKPNRIYLNIKTWASVGVSVREQLRMHWRRWLETQGVSARPVGVQNQEELIQELQALGGQLTEVEAIRYPLRFTLSEELERFASRAYSDAWEIPDDIFDASMKELRTWSENEYGGLDQQMEDEVRFVIDIVRFED